MDNLGFLPVEALGSFYLNGSFNALELDKQNREVVP